MRSTETTKDNADVVWLDNVEIAVAKVVSRKPVVYVRNIYKYYVAYKLLTEGKVAAAGG